VAPLDPDPVLRPPGTVLFLDGMRRIDARIWVHGSNPPPGPGIAASFAREINRELSYLSVLESRDAAGMIPAEAVAAGGAALIRLLAMIDDCEWRLRRPEAEGKDASMLPDPGELRRRLGLPVGSSRAV
jgi:hypothetical protein